jgi:outer membrane lipopolysaccharide assembly protein LptE/RlpB
MKDHRPSTSDYRPLMRDRRRVSMVYCLLSIVLLAGCGYTTSSTLPRSIKTIHVESFKNNIDFAQEGHRNIYLPLLEVKVQNGIINRFLFDGNLKIVEADRADIILKGELTGYDRTVLRYTDEEDAQEYRIHVTVSLELQDAKKQEVSWTESGFVGEATYFVSGSLAKSEESAVDEAVTDLARRVVERTVEDW